jgi:hypothetical protein
MKGSDRLEDLSEDGTIILKLILKKYRDRRGLNLSGLLIKKSDGLLSIR